MADGTLTTAVVSRSQAVRLAPTHVLFGFVAVLGAALVGLSVGTASIPVSGVVLELLDHVPGLSVDSGLSELHQNIVWEIRFPRVVLGLLVGALLACSGAAYQGAFRNPLADPFLLGIAAGAGLGATVGFVFELGDGSGPFDAIPLLAFAGALFAVVLAFAFGATGERGRSSTTLLLAGVAVASLLTAAQTYLVQRDTETLRQVYTWILGRLTTAGWTEVVVVLPYAVVSVTVMLWHRRALDVLAVGDDEAATLGISPRRTRTIVVVAASLAAAAAVAVSGLIGFVGLVVPHGVRLAFGTSNRVVLPLSLLFGAAFLALADVAARTVESPAELPIGVVTAFVGAPFFLYLLRTSQGPR